MSEELTTAESTRLSEIESEIDDGKTAIRRGLLEIRDRRLYRDSDETFEGYCARRWNISRQHAHRLAAAEETIALIQADQECNPGVTSTTEKAVRPLSQLPKSDRTSAWKEAAATAPKASNGRPKVTAKHVARVVAKRKTPATPAVENSPADENQTPLPDRPDVRESFAALVHLKDALAAHDRLIGSVHKFFGTPGAARLMSQRQRIEAGYKELRQPLYLYAPHALCPDCKGRSKTCGKCDGTGWITREAWQRHQKSRGAA